MKAEEPLAPHTFQLLSRVPGLAHGIFTRHGGVSQPPYDSLNVAWNNGDEPGRVADNLERIRQWLGFDRLVAAPQVHGDLSHLISAGDLGGYRERAPLLMAPPGDALITRLRGVGLMIKVADCQAVLVVDPVKRVIANIHCGWRGSVVGIIAKTIQRLVTECGSRSRDLIAAIGPSLGPCCAEFRNYRDELPPALWRYERRPLHFDFWQISRDQLLAAGLAAENIEVAGRCTVCDADFFSYRREQTTGRQAAVLGWN